MTFIAFVPPLSYNVKAYGAKGDGVTDDTAAIQAAITACQNAGGGVVFFPAGTYKTTGALIIGGQYVTLQGAGYGSNQGAATIQPASGANYDVIRTPLPPSPGTNGYTLTGLCIKNLIIDCSHMTGSTTGQGNGIHFYGAIHCLLESVFVSNCKNWAFLMEGDSTNFAYNVTMIDCLADSGCAAGARFTSCEQSCLYRCIFAGASTATTAAQPYSSGSPTTYAAMLYADVGWIMATNCTFGTSGSYTGEAIKCTNGATSTFRDNLFDSVHGPAIVTIAGSHVIQGNILSGPCKNTNDAIMRIGSGGNTIIGNVVTDGGATPNWTYCVLELGSYAGNIIAENTFLAGTSGVISTNATSTPSIAHNGGYNPVGQVTAPTFPATTVAATNHTGVDVHAYIANGTAAITVVQIAGASGSYVTTGYQIAANGWGSVRIPAGGSVKFTYASGAPTWTWMGD